MGGLESPTTIYLLKYVPLSPILLQKYVPSEVMLTEFIELAPSVSCLNQDIFPEFIELAPSVSCLNQDIFLPGESTTGQDRLIVPPLKVTSSVSFLKKKESSKVEKDRNKLANRRKNFLNKFLYKIKI